MPIDFNIKSSNLSSYMYVYVELGVTVYSILTITMKFVRCACTQPVDK